jgi:hypothetical protein
MVPGSGMDKNQDPGSEINIPDPQHCRGELYTFYGLFLLNVFNVGHPNEA